MDDQRWRSLRFAAGVLLSCTTMVGAAGAANCTDRSAQLQAGYIGSASDWQEFDVGGRRLVHESGTLQGPELSASLQCGDWELAAALAELTGSRLYDGQTNFGVPITSQAALRQSLGHVQASFRFSEVWRLGVRVSGQTTWRDIASVGGASGYPERFDWTIFSVGSQWKSALGPGQITLAAWAGTPLTSGMTLNLPGRDQAALALGSVTQFELAMGWRIPLQGGWSLQADVRYLSTEVGQGPDVVIQRSGIPVGVAHQPRTSMVDVPIAFRIGYEF